MKTSLRIGLVILVLSSYPPFSPPGSSGSTTNTSRPSWFANRTSSNPRSWRLTARSRCKRPLKTCRTATPLTTLNPSLLSLGMPLPTNSEILFLFCFVFIFPVFFFSVFAFFMEVLIKDGGADTISLYHL